MKNPIHPVVAGLGPSATLAINERSNSLRAQGRTIYKFGLGQSPFPVPEPVVQSLRDHAHVKDYLPVQGLPQLRDAVSAYYGRHDGLETSGSEVVVGPGSKELQFLLQLVFEGETILPSPRWVSYLPQAQISRRPVASLPTTFDGRWRLTPQLLDDHCRQEKKPRLLFLNYPGNPDGLTYDPSELEGLAEVARKHEVVVLSDEIYGPLHHEGAHVSMARYYPEGTVVSGGLSKWCGAGGWRLGVLVFPKELEWLRRAVQVVASETFTSVSAPIQFAAVRGFEEGEGVDGYVADSRRVLKALGMHFASELRAVGTRVHDPQGAFYLMMDFEQIRESLNKRGVETSEQLCEQILTDTGVAFLPGSCFGRDPKELSARLAYVNFDGGAALSAAADTGDESLLARLQDVCPEPFAGLTQLTDWLKL